MTDFVIVVVAAAALAAPLAAPAVPGPSHAGRDAAPAAATSVPLNAPTVGFHAYADAAACEQDAANLAAPPRTRLVCVPVEPLGGGVATPY